MVEITSKISSVISKEMMLVCYLQTFTNVYSGGGTTLQAMAGGGGGGGGDWRRALIYFQSSTTCTSLTVFISH